MSEAHAGDVVRIHYTGRFPDGEVFDSSEGRDPLQFIAGSEELIPAVSQAVVGMVEGDSKTIEVEPARGYGDRRPELEHEIPTSILPEGTQVGDQLQAEMGEHKIPVWVRELKEDKAVIDANHPLAGKTLVFDIHLVAVGAPES